MRRPVVSLFAPAHFNNQEGGPEDNYLFGDAGADRLRGNGGDDTLLGEGGDDSISGGDGADVLRDVQGTNTLRGGAGDDRIYAGYQTKILDGGAGFDLGQLSYLSFSGPVELDASRTGSGKTVRLVNGSTVNVLTDVERVFFTGSAFDDTLIGGRNSDTLTGDEGADLLKGGTGDDVLYDREGNDTFVGGGGNDRLRLGYSGFQDWVSGDFLLDGGDGFDTFVLQGSPSETTTLQLKSGVLTGASGVAEFSGLRLEALFVELGALQPGATISGWNADDVIYVGHGANSLRGGAGDDTLSGAGSVDGGAGDDLIWRVNPALEPDGGHPPAEATISGGTGHDHYGIYVIDGAKLDFSAIDPSQAAPIAVTLGWTDVITGIEGLRLVATGEASAESLVGSQGDDIIDAAHGADTVRGHDGDDVLYGVSGLNPFGQVAGGDTYDGGEGDDTVWYVSKHAVEVDLQAGAARLAYGVVDTLISIETVVGGEGDDVIGGDGRANRLAGGAGADRLNGAGGADTLVGGLGGDVMRGGAGRDVFLYETAADSTAAATDQIQLFEAQDVIDVSAIDARANKEGDQAFRLVEAFTGYQGQAVIVATATGSELRLDLDGDMAADGVVAVSGAGLGAEGLVL